MPTALAAVKVTRLTHDAGFAITCSSPLCVGWMPIRFFRLEADVLAINHRASHQTPTHEED